jgi:tetratricopeptide (TPR) repeat protein
MRYLDLMKARAALANGFVASLFVLWAAGAQADLKNLPDSQNPAGSAKLDELFQQLQSSDDAAAAAITEDIWREWSKSGSAAMDLLLQRGEAAMAMGDPMTAIYHASALIDHAPDFAEAYNLRATAYFQMGELGLSLGDISRTLALNPRHFGALAGLGAIFEELNEPAKALEVYREALKINPHMPDVAEAIARIDTKIGGQEL